MLAEIDSESKDCSQKLLCVNGSTFVIIELTDFHTTCSMQDVQLTSAKEIAVGNTVVVTSAKLIESKFPF